MGKIGTLKRHWFLRGLAVGFILIAAANAVSYFYLSDGWSDLIGATSNQEEVVGFPFEMWRENHFYNGWIVNVTNVNLNGAIALLVGVVVGAVFVWFRGTLNGWVDEFEKEEGASSINEPLKLQFSVKGMLVSIIAISIVTALINAWGPCPEILAVVYFFGPLVLVILAMMPSGIKWEQRVVVLLILALAMLVAVVVAGTQMGLDFDRVLFGVFLCWTPQSTLAALLLTCGLVAKRLHSDGGVISRVEI